MKVNAGLSGRIAKLNVTLILIWNDEAVLFWFIKAYRTIKGYITFSIAIDALLYISWRKCHGDFLEERKLSKMSFFRLFCIHSPYTFINSGVNVRCCRIAPTTKKEEWNDDVSFFQPQFCLFFCLRRQLTLLPAAKTVIKTTRKTSSLY